VSQKIQNPPARSKLHVIVNSNQPIPTATPLGIKSQIAFLLSNKDPESVNQATPINNHIIVQGMRDKKVSLRITRKDLVRIATIQS
jgi:hypothetical protein